MKQLLIIMAVMQLAAAPSQAQPGQNTPLSYINRKSVSVGYGLNGLNTNGLNEVLKSADYAPLQESISVGTVNVSTDFGPRWGGFYAVDLGTQRLGEGSPRYARLQYLRFYGGAEFSAFRQHQFELLCRAAFSYSLATVRLYDMQIDTSSFTGYLAGPADAKRFTTGKFGLDAGLQTRFRITENFFLGTGAGYILSPSGSDWKHDAGGLHGTPETGLGSWYINIRVGALFYRRITRMKPEEFEEGGKPDGVPVNAATRLF